MLRNVAYWSVADIPVALANVRFEGRSGHH